MSEIKRDLRRVLKQKFGKGKVLVLVGPRQVGKTTLLKTLLSETGAGDSVQYWNCDEIAVREMLSQKSRLNSNCWWASQNLLSSMRRSVCRTLG